MLLLANIRFQKKSAQEEVTEAREVAIPQSLSLATWLASLFWEIDVITCYFPVEAVIITFFSTENITYVQVVCSTLSRNQLLCTGSFSVEESMYMIIGFGASTIFAAEMVKYKSQSSR